MPGSIPYRDSQKEPLLKGAVYFLEDMYYLIDQDIPKKPNQPLDALDSNNCRATIPPSSFQSMFRLDKLSKDIVIRILRQNASFLEKHLEDPAQSPRKYKSYLLEATQRLDVARHPLSQFPICSYLRPRKVKQNPRKCTDTDYHPGRYRGGPKSIKNNCSSNRPSHRRLEDNTNGTNDSENAPFSGR